MRGINNQQFSSTKAILIYLSLFKFLLLIIFAHSYGIFRDEYYYIECSKNLAWGYVDLQPLSTIILAVSRTLFGESILAIRIFSYAAGSAFVFVSGLLAREMGGGKFAQILTAILVIFCGVLLGVSGYFSMNSFDILLAVLMFYYLLKLINSDDKKYWLFIGLIFGIGLQNKLSFLFIGFGLAVGLIITNYRKHLMSKELWMGTGLALLILLPNIIWQIANDFPTLEFMRNAAMYKNEALSPIEFTIGMLFELNPGFTPFLLIGIYFFFFEKDSKKFRLIGWIFIAVLLVFMFNKGKPYYMGILYPVMLAAGAVGTAKLIERFVKKRIWVYSVIFILMIPNFILVTPFAISILPVEDFIAFQETTGIKPSSGEVSSEGVLPQFFADRFGWEEMVQKTADIYNKLSDEEKERVIIIADNYGEAGAIDYYKDKYNLPEVIAPHNNYWIWGNDTKYDTDIYIILDITRENALQFFEEAKFGRSHYHPYGKPDENIDIFICREPKEKLSDFWERVRNFI